MKKRFLPMTLITILLFSIIINLLYGCATQTHYDIFNPPDFTPTKAPKDWLTFVLSTKGHKNIKPINLDKVPATHIELSENQIPDYILPLSDGGCLAISQIPIKDNEKTGVAFYSLQATRFKADGSVLWENKYDSIIYQGYLKTVCVFPDDGFAVSMNANLNSSGVYTSLEKLYRFSSNGSFLWGINDSVAANVALDHLFALTDGTLLAAGSVNLRNLDGSFRDNNIGLFHFEKDGTLLKQKIFGAQRNDNLISASKTGSSDVILFWKSQSESGNNTDMETHLECFDDNLDSRWVYKAEKNENISDVISLPDGKGVIVFAALVDSQNNNSGISSFPMILHFDDSGKKTWTYTASIEQKAWMKAATSLKDGRIVAGWFNNQPSDKGQESNLGLFSETGTLLDSIEKIPGVIEQIIPTKDGGFTAILTQTVSGLPQPPFVSSIWFDTEKIVIHYDKNLHITWQRSIDQYKHEKRSDIVIPTVDERLLIG
ncbi:MAG: hypothetical protein ACYCYI_03515 [Saccharofermentanales bacterium]